MSNVQWQISVLVACKAFDNPGGFLLRKPLRIVLSKTSAVIRDAFAPPSETAFTKPYRLACLGKPCAILDSLFNGGKDFAFS